MSSKIINLNHRTYKIKYVDSPNQGYIFQDISDLLEFILERPRRKVKMYELDGNRFKSLCKKDLEGIMDNCYLPLHQKIELRHLLFLT